LPSPIFFSDFFPRGATMFDDSIRLRENPQLLALLSHYARLGSEDQENWRDRLMQMEGVTPKELAGLHGVLIAMDWIEQNSGNAIFLKDGTLSACYRITLGGLREYRRFNGHEGEFERADLPEKAKPKFPRKKKAKAEALVAATAE
jgi:hypothetical protein